MALLGEPRSTMDLDVLILAEPETWERLVAAAQRHDLRPRVPDPIPFARLSRVLLMQHGASGVPVDVSLGVLPFERQAVANATSVQVHDTQIPVPRPEDLLIMKAFAHREIDLADMPRLIRANPQIDLAYVRARVAEFASLTESPEMLEDFDRIVRRAEG